MNAAEFRHGPLELVSPGFTALIFAGSAKTASLNRNLAQNISKNGGHVIWIDMRKDLDLSTISIPLVSESILPLVEILPMQMLTLVMAGRKKVTAGQFRNIEKITAIE